MVKWSAELAFSPDSPTIKQDGYTCDGSWPKLREKILNDEWPPRIIKLEVSNENGVGKIDDNCDGYYIGNKAIAILASNANLDLVGIGYWKKHESVARIKWYNKKNMELVITEARPVSECEYFIIKNR